MYEDTYTQGSLFAPDSAYRRKLFIYVLIMFLGVTASVTLILGLLIIVFSVDREPSPSLNRLQTFLQNFGDEIIIGYILLNLLWIIPTVIFVIYYVRAIGYSLGTKEVIIRKGIINKTVKHIPFRTITNVSSRYGLLDRVFGIGTVEIETAGHSGYLSEPEAKIEGIKKFLEVRDIILRSLREFSGPYATTTETDQQKEPLSGDQKFFQELLLTLNEIRDLLK